MNRKSNGGAKELLCHVSVRSVLKVLATLGMIFVFCPSFLVSCSGSTMKIGALNVLVGIRDSGRQVVEPYPGMVVFWLLPAGMLLLLFWRRRLDGRRCALLVLVLAAADLVLWLIFCAQAKRAAESYACTFRTTVWFVLNLLSLALILFLTSLVVSARRELDGVLVRELSATGGQGVNPWEHPMESVPVGKREGKRLRVRGLPIALAAAAILAAVVALVMVHHAPPTIDLDQYLTIRTSGYDGYGTAEASIDWAALQKKYRKRLSFTDEAKEEGGLLIAGMSPVEAMKLEVGVKLSPADHLSNGDRVSYRWTVPEYLSGVLRGKLVCSDRTQKVKGLKRAGSFDAFAGVKVRFSGTAPDGEARVKVKGGRLSESDFTCSKEYGLSNGDVITLSLRDTDRGQYIEQFGKVPEKTKMKVTVSGLDEWVQKYTDLSQTFLDRLHREAEDSIASATADDEDDVGAVVKDVAYAGYILEAAKDPGEIFGASNRLYLIYTATFSATDGRFPDQKLWLPVEFTDLLRTQDGLTYDENLGVQGFSVVEGTWTGTDGYLDQMELYSDLVTRSRRDYTAEVSEGMKP